ncbi:hypothetical protein RJ640_014833 [Escallonia rubra]|uniref:F-box domain-containing protein n=1 Tax=Escallonia rubra TaxID=112253 RepID=A0AA88R996_9ASTE|nr:hypothetical protein RJ640_014833 [Escallonia rubra]
MSNGVNLPEDIVEDILTRLPATSLGRFRCVSKPWRARISHPLFVKTHLSRSNKRARVLVRSNINGYLYSLSFDSELHRNIVGIAKKLNFKADDSRYVEGSCNGLVLIDDGVKRSLLLFNPTTQESSKLPVSTFENPPWSSFHYGLGYDSGTDDYKVVKLIYGRMVERNGSKSSNILVDIYATKSGCWRRLKILSCHCFEYTWWAGYGIFVNGSLHWLAAPNKIIAFDLVEEKFREIPLPSGCVLHQGGQLVVLDGCVGTVSWSEGDVDEVWVMKEYGAVDSWTKFPNVSPRKEYKGVSVQVLCSLGDRKILSNDKLTREKFHIDDMVASRDSDEKQQQPWESMPKILARLIKVGHDTMNHRSLLLKLQELGTDDYKVVKLIYDRMVERNGSKSSNILVDIYATKSGCWRRLKNLSGHYFEYVWGGYGIFVIGSLHWLDGVKTIIAFDLAEEEFREMPLPSGCMLHHGRRLVVLDGCLGIICWNEVGVDAIWVMKEYGAMGSWIKFPIVSRV